MKKYITTEEAIKHCEEENYVIPGVFLSVFPNKLGINLCAVKGFDVETTDDGQYKSIRIDFIPEEHDNLQEQPCSTSLPSSPAEQQLNLSSEHKTDTNNEEA